MSLPNIPDITPEINLKRQEVIHLMIASIAMEEISLSHLMNAEAEKIQAILARNASIHEIMEMNRSVERMLRNVIKQQMLLQFKLEDILLYKPEEKPESECYEEE